MDLLGLEQIIFLNYQQFYMADIHIDTICS
jgi:hypothetical protein